MYSPKNKNKIRISCGLIKDFCVFLRTVILPFQTLPLTRLFTAPTRNNAKPEKKTQKLLYVLWAHYLIT